MNSPHLLFLITVFLLANVIGLVQGAPWPPHTKHATHRVRNIGKSLVTTYHPKRTFKTYGQLGAASALNAKQSGPKALSDFAMDFAISELNVDPKDIGYRSGYSGPNRQHAYLNQFHDGIPIANAVANVGFMGDKVVSFGSSFVDTKQVRASSSTPTINYTTILPQVEEDLDGKFNGKEPALEYVVQPDDSLELTHVLQIENEQSGAWVEAFVSAHSGKILSVNDFVSEASYTVIPINKLALPDGLETIQDPQDLAVSPLGWHNTVDINRTTTSGNNVIAVKGQVPSDQTSPSLNFNTAYDDAVSPTSTDNVEAAITNAFYIANTVHDVAYRYGFTEQSFNFQFDNFDKGGTGGDPVYVSVQDASGTNNANFASPPDGQPGVLRIFLFTSTNPSRDGALENDLVIHEMTHGITNRLTGGGTGRCLQSTESAGLGEGWSDAMADWMAQTSEDTKDFVMGQYILGSDIPGTGKGIRRFPYSTDPNVNPLRYSDLQTKNEVHDIGEVWANMMHNVYAALVQERGFAPDARTNPDGPEGNIVFLRLFMDSLALQPCNPTFISARDAWIQADINRFNGANQCTLFNAFASRGLGVNAGPDFQDDTTIPAGC